MNNKRNYFLFWVAITLIAASAVYQRFHGLSPKSLWLDDVWAALLARSASVSFIFNADVPCSPCFILLLKVIVFVFGAGEAQMQILPFCVSLTMVFLFAYLLLRFTKMFSLSIIAAVFIAANPLITSYSLRVKPFILDSFIILLILLLSTRCLERKDKESLYFLSILSALAIFVSYVSLFLSVFAVGILHWRLLAEKNVPKKAVIVSCLGYYVLFLVMYVFLIKGRGNPSLYVYWKEYYIPVESAKSCAEFLKNKGLMFFKGAFISKFSWLAVFIPLGIFRLIFDKEKRPIGLSIVCFYASIIAAGVLKIYPIGGGRTDIFTFPISIFAAVVGVWTFAKRFKWSGVLLCAAVIVLFVKDSNTRAEYPNNFNKEAVQLLNKQEKSDDAIIIFPWANWAVGYYGKWKPLFVKVEDSTNGFFVEPKRHNTYVLRETWGGVDFRDSSDVITSQLAFMKNDQKRILYLACSVFDVSKKPHEWIIENIIARGYAVEYEEKFIDGCFMVFRKQS